MRQSSYPSRRSCFGTDRPIPDSPLFKVVHKMLSLSARVDFFFRLPNKQDLPVTDSRTCERISAGANFPEVHWGHDAGHLLRKGVRRKKKTGSVITDPVSDYAAGPEGGSRWTLK
jgi:hypothetical protein